MAVRYGTPQLFLRSTVRLFCNGTGMVRSTVRTLFEFAYYKRFVCNVQPLMKIRATVPGVHIVYAIIK